jgi:hypothetical protein
LYIIGLQQDFWSILKIFQGTMYVIKEELDHCDVKIYNNKNSDFFMSKCLDPVLPKEPDPGLVLQHCLCTGDPYYVLYTALLIS